MLTKLKKLSFTIILISGTTILLFGSTYESSAVEKSSTVSCEQSIANDNRGYKDNITQIHIVTETPVAGMSLLLNKVDDNKIEKCITNVTKYSDEEIKILERTTEAEATGGDIKSKENIVSVILNRVDSKSFPDTIKQVVFQKSQFSCVSDGRYYEVEISKETKKAVKNVLKNGRTTNALYFFNIRDIESVCIKNWINNKLTFLFTDDINHSFYKDKE